MRMNVKQRAKLKRLRGQFAAARKIAKKGPSSKKNEANARESLLESKILKMKLQTGDPVMEKRRHAL